MNKRLSDILKEVTADPKVMSQRKLGQLANLTNTTIGRLIKGHKPDPETLKKLAPWIGYSLEELMVMEEYLPESLMADVTPVEGIVMLPILGKVQGGEPMRVADEEILGYFPAEASEVANGDYYYLKVSGDSMAPRIEPDDYVLVKVGSVCENGRIAVVAVEEEATLKRIYWQGQTTILHSDNANYPPRIVSTKDVIIYGCVHRIIKDAR